MNFEFGFEYFLIFFIQILVLVIRGQLRNPIFGDILKYI